ncbi:MAG: MFS transporter, partial [Rhodospirillales bacterium]|nr:MFS transporter [Rhodospirillales bacterium]
DDLTPAIGLNSALFNISRFLGPMIAGVVIAQFGAGAAFATAVFGMLAFSIGLQFVELNRHEHAGGKRKGLGTDILEGVTYVLRHTSIGSLLLLIMVSAIFSRSFLELFPGFADEVFNQGAEGLGILFSAVGGGGIIGAFWLANYGKTEGLMKVSLVTLFITAVALILFASTTVFWFALICAAFAGLTMAITANASQVLIQNTVDGAFRGRVMSLYGLTYRAGPSVGALVLGSASTVVGFQWPVIMGGVLCLLSIALVIPRYKRLSTELEKTA